MAALDLLLHEPFCFWFEFDRHIFKLAVFGASRKLEFCVD
jgi:hypothetical protein